MKRLISKKVESAKQVGQIYHKTNISSMLSILKDNCINADGDGYVSFTRNENFESELIGNPIQCAIVIDGDKLSENRKIKPYNDFPYAYTGATKDNYYDLLTEDKWCAIDPSLEWEDHLTDPDFLKDNGWDDIVPIDKEWAKKNFPFQHPNKILEQEERIQGNLNDVINFIKEIDIYEDTLADMQDMKNVAELVGYEDSKISVNGLSNKIKEYIEQDYGINCEIL